MMSPSDALAAARLAFSRERATIESARCMVIGTSGSAPHSAIAGALENLTREAARMEAAEATLVKIAEEAMIRRARKRKPQRK